MNSSLIRTTSIAAVVLLLAAGHVAAATFNLEGVVTNCTPTCLSFAFLGADPGDPTDAPSQLVGFLELDDAAIADGTWVGADVTGFSFTVFDPARPVVAHDPPDQVTDNPFVLDQSVNGGGIVVAAG